MVRQADLARARDAAAADEPGRRDRVVRRAEGAAHDQRAARIEETRDRVDARDRDRLVEAERRQDARAAAGRASSCRRPGGPIMSIECPPAAATSSARRAAPWPADLGQVRARRRLRRRRAARPASSDHRARAPRRPSRMSTASRSVGGAEHLDARHEGGLGGVGARHDDPRPPLARRVLGHGERAGHGAQGAVERQLARPPRARRAPPAASWPEAARIASASGRSYWGPALRRSAGARLATIRRAGTAKAWLARPERTRSRASWTATSASPTTENDGQARAQVDLHLDGRGLEAEDGGAEELGDHVPTLPPVRAPTALRRPVPGDA